MQIYDLWPHGFQADDISLREFARACIKTAVTLPEGAQTASQRVKHSGTIGFGQSPHRWRNDESPTGVALLLTDGPGAVHTVFIPDQKPKTQPETINILGYEFFMSDLREALTDKQLRDTLRAALGEVENG